jgi:peptidoglycan/LPS O-acetylase OafA/YrhL
MNDVLVHALLFALVSAVIVLLGSFHSEAEDGRAYRGYPRRLMVFLFGSAVLAGVMLVCEHTFASL